MRVLPENPVPQHPAPPGSDSLDPYNLIGMTRLGATAVSPDGSLAVLSAKRYDWAAKKNDEQFVLHATGDCDMNGRKYVALPQGCNTSDPDIKRKYNLF